jgi:hypothetical protein
MAKKETDVVVRKEGGFTIEALISQAIDKGISVETMERLLEMRKQLKAEAAKEAFVSALGQFQQDCPTIKKTKQVMNKDGQTVRYQYAPLDGIASQIKKDLAANDLSYSWDVKHTEGHMDVTCKVTHKMGHSEVSTLQIPIDKDGFMTAPQKYASAQTFAKRYTLLNSLGITTADEDTDATDVRKEPTAKSEKSKIIFLLRTLGHKVDTKENVADSVLKLTHLELEHANFVAIVDRLEALVQEQHEGTDVR